MAKIALTKLGLKDNAPIEKITFNDMEIEIKQYLPFEDKLTLIDTVLRESSEDMYFYNCAKLDLYFAREIILYYTNISLTENQQLDFVKWYNRFLSSGLYGQILQYIPSEEINYLHGLCEKQIQSIYHYRDSALGVLESLKNDYSDMDLDIEKLQQSLVDNESVQNLQNIVEKIG